MKKKWNVLVVLGALLCGSMSFAREFYQIEVKVDLTYTNIESGTVGVFQNQVARVRFSDDRQFCVFYIGGGQFNCLVDYINAGNITDYTQSYMTGKNWQAAFNALQAAGVLGAPYNEKLQRILGQCKDGCNFRTTDWHKIYYQIDDGQPEAFHLFVHDQSKAQKL